MTNKRQIIRDILLVAIALFLAIAIFAMTAMTAAAQNGSDTPGAPYLYFVEIGRTASGAVILYKRR